MPSTPRSASLAQQQPDDFFFLLLGSKGARIFDKGLGKFVFELDWTKLEPLCAYLRVESSK